MIILAILLLISALALVCIGLAGVAGLWYGESRSRARWIVQQRRELVRSERSTRQWQDKFLVLKGAGPLLQTLTPQSTSVRTNKRFITRTQVINDLREKVEGRVGTAPAVSQRPTGVPEPIAQEFLKDAASAVNKTS